MGENQMNVRYDPKADILYILVKKGSVKDTIEVCDDLFVEYGESGNIVGIELWQARKNVLGEFMKYLEQVTKVAAEVKA